MFCWVTNPPVNTGMSRGTCQMRKAVHVMCKHKKIQYHAVIHIRKPIFNPSNTIPDRSGMDAINVCPRLYEPFRVHNI